MLDQGRDQAAGLRARMAAAAPGLLAFPLEERQAPGWIARLAHALRAIGRKPLVIDAGAGALTAVFGLRLRHELMDMLEGTRRFDEVAGATADGVVVLRAHRGVEAFAASGAPRLQLLEGFGRLSHGFQELMLAMPPDELACLADPQQTTPVIGLAPGNEGIVDAYALVKRLADGFGYRRFACVACGDADEGQARLGHARLAATVERFLRAELDFAGWLPRRAAAHDAAPGLAAAGLLQLASAPIGVACAA